jgi:hypothetical protein
MFWFFPIIIFGMTEDHYFGDVFSYFLAIYIVIIISIFVITRINTLKHFQVYLKQNAKLDEKSLNVNSVVNLVVEEHLSKRAITYSFFIFSTLLIIIFTYLVKTEYSIVIYLLVFSLTSGLFISDLLMKYRVMKGYYGCRQSEAREIIEFILENSNKIPPKESGKELPILTSLEVEEMLKRIPAIESGKEFAF